MKNKNWNTLATENKNKYLLNNEAKSSKKPATDIDVVLLVEKKIVKAKRPMMMHRQACVCNYKCLYIYMYEYALTWRQMDK